MAQPTTLPSFTLGANLNDARKRTKVWTILLFFFIAYNMCLSIATDFFDYSLSTLYECIITALCTITLVFIGVKIISSLNRLNKATDDLLKWYDDQLRKKDANPANPVHAEFFPFLPPAKSPKKRPNPRDN